MFVFLHNFFPKLVNELLLQCVLLFHIKTFRANLILVLICQIYFASEETFPEFVETTEFMYTRECTSHQI
jgi:hypothetical protein